MKVVWALLALAVIAVVVFAALALSRAPAAPAVTTPTLTTITTSSTPTSSSQSTSASSSSSESTGLSQRLASFLAKNISSVSQFFSQIHTFTVTATTGTGQKLASTTQSWTYVDSPTINGTSYTEVTVNCSGSQPCQYPSPYTLWVADNGSVPIIEYGGVKYAYANALYSGGPTIGLEDMVGYWLAPYLAKSFLGLFAFNGTGSLQAGAAQIPTYTWTLASEITYPGNTVNQASVTLGVLPSGNSILLRLDVSGVSVGANAAASVEVTSLTLA